MSESCLVGLQQVKGPLDSGNLIAFIVHKDTYGVITAPTAELFPFLNKSFKKSIIANKPGYMIKSYLQSINF